VEIRARYVQMGAFTLAALVAGFAFVYWLNNAGALRDRAVYRVRFESSVGGLQRGSAVYFNGIRVGEVTRLDLNPAEPRQVHATLEIDRATPVSADTAVTIDFQGMTGSPVVALTGGTSDQPLTSAKGEPPLLVADVGAGQGLSQAARGVLNRLDVVLAENAQPLRSMVANLETFSRALARNSDRLDGIVAGLERMTGGAAAKARLVPYDLTVPSTPESTERPLPLQLVVPDPTALAALDSERIQTAKTDGGYASLPDAQWADALPKLVQAKLLRILEDAGRFAGVSRPLEGVTGDRQLMIDIRKFHISRDLAAEVELGCKLLGDNGRIIATRIFRASAKAEAQGAPAAVAALESAFGQTVTNIVAWTAHTANPAPPQRGALPRRTGGG
jgi:phospholipid/cholesterol/gamma-HCH transport system substrate-binding protein